MADDIPVLDVLREATEYLSKLGSNLRIRSENLKQKKIRRNKLNNSHAIKKAADKVLLICELSKKSLENVESGVKKVLSALHSAQNTPSGGKLSSSPKAPAEKVKYHYFEYQSYKLRISKKIPLKHFMSVKVLARSMPISMQENYPVYHDCKLYRLRNKIRRKSLENNSSICEPKISSDNLYDGESKKIIHQLDNDNHTTAENISNTNSSKDINDENSSGYIKCTKNDLDSDNIFEKSKINNIVNDDEVSDFNVSESKKNKRLSHNNDSNDLNNDDICTAQVTTSSKDMSVVNNSQKSESEMTNLCEKSTRNSKDDSDNNLCSTDIQISKDKFPTEQSSITNVSPGLNSSNNEKCEKQSVNDSINTDLVNDNISVSQIEQCKKHLINDSDDSDIGSIKKSKTRKRFSLDDDSGDVSMNAETPKNDANSNRKHDSKNVKESNKRKRILFSDDSNDSLTNDDTPVSQINTSTKKKFKSENVTRKRSVSCVSINSNGSNEDIQKTKSNNDEIIVLDDTVITLDDTIVNLEKNDSSSKHKSKKIKLIESDVDNKENEKSNYEDSEHEAEKNETNTNKPMIKCVSLSKLLKPDILNKFADISSQKIVNQTQKISKVNKKKDLDEECVKNKTKLKSTSDNNQLEEEYWSEKRKEVKNFKPKNFVINVIRLPNLSVEFLLAHNLKRIIRDELVICEVIDELHNLGKELTSIPVESHKERCIENSGEINEIKNSLLNDSDTEQPESSKSQNYENTETDETEVVKNALLHESDSDNGNKGCSETMNIKQGKDDAKSSDCKTKNSDIEKTVDDVVDKSKSALLFSSDSENNSEGNDKPTDDKNLPQSNILNSFNGNKEQNEKLKDGRSEESLHSEKNNETEIQKHLSSPENTENVKITLEDSLESTQATSERKQNVDSVIPRSKRKHIMESMHAKKMLLTYSSSSDTEDEQLRSVLKEIKDSLLTGVSGSEDENGDKKNKGKQHQSKLNFSSGSEDNENQKDTSPARPSTSSKNNSSNESESKSSRKNEDVQSNSSSTKVRS